MIRTEKLRLEKAWDKTFEKSDKVDHSKVTFVLTTYIERCRRKNPAAAFLAYLYRDRSTVLQ